MDIKRSFKKIYLKIIFKTKEVYIPIENGCERVRDWAESLIEKKKINEDGFLDYQIIKTKWDDIYQKKKLATLVVECFSISVMVRK